jgi:hypothetical protein
MNRIQHWLVMVILRLSGGITEVVSSTILLVIFAWLVLGRASHRSRL